MLSKERIAELKMYFTRCVQSRSLSTVVHLAECGLELIEMVEALQQENEQLKGRLQISPYGDDKIDELEEALENCKFQYENIKKENEQLQAKLESLRCERDRVI